MAIPGARTIVVGDGRYHWRVTGSEPWLDPYAVLLVVQDASGSGQKLIAWIPIYPERPRRSLVPVETSARFTAVRARGQEAIVTPRVVRPIVEYALRAGWTPARRAADFVVPEAALRPILLTTQPGWRQRKPPSP